MKPRPFVSSVLLAFACASHPATSATLHVWQDSPSPGPPYATWTTAAHVIQDAVDAAVDGDTVLVTNGVYTAGGRVVGTNQVVNRVAIDRAITVQSVNGPEVTSMGIFIPSINPLRAAYVGSNAVLSGFTLRGKARTSGDSTNEMSGGAVWCEASGVVKHCILLTSLAAWGGGVFGGILYNCVLNDNRARTNGGGAYGTTLYNCTLARNSAGGSGGGAFGGELYNCIIYDNTAPVDSNYGSIEYLTFSCTSPLPTNGVGNISDAPGFRNALGGDFRLTFGSPCIDAGMDLSSFLTTDLEGKPRPMDGNGDHVAGYDMGAYEYGVALRIALAATGDQAILSWVSSAGETYVLEETPAKSPPVWRTSPRGSVNPVAVDVSGVDPLFRLKRSISNMVWIPPGTFVMGSPPDEPVREGNEGPRTEVTISRGFWMGKFEVTQGEYLEVVGSNPSFFRNGTEGFGTGGPVTNESRHPVETVQWYGATNYCHLLTERERAAGRLPGGYEYRLPTEAQWEYACRAGTMTPFHYGEELKSGMANFDGRAEYPPCGGEDSCRNPSGIWLGRTVEVGSYLPNAWGLYDMHGNVGEWCQDWYEYWLPGGSVTDPTGPVTSYYRVVRGGYCYSVARMCRCAYREGDAPGSRLFDIGFRVALVAVP